MDKKIIGRLASLFGLVMLVVAGLFLHHELHNLRAGRLVEVMGGMRQRQLALAAICSAFSYLALTLYDALALRYAKCDLPYPRVALTSFIGYAFSNTFGHSIMTGGSVRLRMYSEWGLGAGEIARVIGFGIVTFAIGGMLMLGISLVGEAHVAGALIGLSPGVLRGTGALMIATVGAYVVACGVRRAPMKLLRWEVSLPSPPIAWLQCTAAVLDLILCANVLYVLLPPGMGIPYLAFMGMFFIALLAGMLSMIPGGLGVFEAAFIALAGPEVSKEQLVGALILYRLFYQVGPAILGAMALAVFELRRVQKLAAPLLAPGSILMQRIVPGVLAGTTFAAGAIMLLSGAMRPASSRLLWLTSFLPAPVIEISHFLGSIAGMVLLVLARGIQRKIDAAYFAVVGLLSAGVLLSLAKGFDYEEGFALAAILLLMVPCRHAFYRRAALFAGPFTRRWTIAIAAASTAAVALGIFSHRHTEFSNEMWWRFSLDDEAPRSMRATVSALALVLGFSMVRLLSPRKPAPLRPRTGELERAAAIAALSPACNANLALLGDKTLLFSKTNTAFIMYGVQGRDWVSMGDPVGPEPEWRDLAWAFREVCDRHGGRTTFYQVPRESLPLYVDLGLALTKLGEEARVALSSFNLDGSNRAKLRRAVRSVERAGCTFEVLVPEETTRQIDTLHAVSMDWLARKNTREKAFSVGAFADAYIRRFTVGVVKREGAIVAFANLWQGAEKQEISVDLMRYLAGAPDCVMDFLFVQLMLWAKAQGFRHFSLGMAPLSGLEGRELAPLWTRAGALLFRHGEHFYNFQGLRQYKEKFDPEWVPRYLASQGGLALPQILTSVAALIAGGVRGIVAR